MQTTAGKMEETGNKIERPPSPSISIRRLTTHEDYKACVALQKETWGENFVECVPPAILMVSQKIGGLTAGAFDASGKMLGFVFGMTGVKDGRLVHWSDMLAVRPEVRDIGLGQKLKLYQRELVHEIGVEAIYWTYDPLVARNAHLNLNRLGVKVREYVPDMYGEDMAGELNRGLGTDRFVVEWDISEERKAKGEVRGAKGEEREAKSVEREQMINIFGSVVNTEQDDDGSPEPIVGELPEVSPVRVEIPNDIQVVKAASPQRAGEWRASTRHAFMFYLQRGYDVTGFFRDAESIRCFYLMSLKEN